MSAGIYLDWNATAPLRPAAREAMTAALTVTGNPSSVHRFGREARRIVETARARVAALAGAGSASVVFTSGATEANMLALHGFDRPLVVSAVEHASVLGARDDATPCPVDGAGRIDLAALAALLRSIDRPALVGVMAANNETGVVQPIEAVVAVARSAGALVHCDAAQVVGRLPFDATALGADLVSVSAHKLGGPQGVGALIVGPAVALRSLWRGGGQERGLRPGTENVAAIAGFGAACEAAAAELDQAPRIAALRDRLERLARARVPATVVVGDGVERLPNTAALALPGAEASTLVMALDLAGIAVSAGAACSSGKVQPSHVLAAMAVPEPIRRATLRVSLGATTTAADIDLFVEAWGQIAARLDSGRRAA